MANDGADGPVSTRDGGVGAVTVAGLFVFGVLGYFGLKPFGIWAVALGDVVKALGAVALVVWGLLARRYIIVLTDARLEGNSIDRQPYFTLRASLEADKPTVKYERWLSEALARVDHFFGDDDPDAASRFVGPHLFGLHTPAPLWTPAAYERCLTLALLYPLAAILVLWIITKHVGSAGDALHLSADATPLQRLALATSIVLPLGYSKALHSAASRHSGLALGLVTIAYFAAVGIAVAVAVAVAGAGAGAVAVAVAGAGAVAVAVAGTAGVLLVYGYTKNRNPQGIFLSCFTIILLALGLLLPHWLARSYTWVDFGPLLLFLGLLTVVNAPFDWFSLGLTRLLLRLGLQHKGWWPYFYAALDAAVAVVIIALLAVAMLLAMQCFDDVATRAGGRATLDLPQLLDSIQTDPGDPENYWVYVTLFSTMIPSLLNLFFGGAALTRCIPGLRRWLLGKMPPSGAVARADVEWVANVLVGQLYFGLGLAVLAQGVLFFGLIGYALPLFGFDLLDQCRALVAADLPGQALRLLFGP